MDGAKAMDVDDGEKGRGEEVPGPDEGTSAGHDAPASPDWEPSDNE